MYFIIQNFVVAVTCFCYVMSATDLVNQKELFTFDSPIERNREERQADGKPTESPAGTTIVATTTTTPGTTTTTTRTTTTTKTTTTSSTSTTTATTAVKRATTTTTKKEEEPEKQTTKRSESKGNETPTKNGTSGSNIFQCYGKGESCCRNNRQTYSKKLNGLPLSMIDLANFVVSVVLSLVLIFVNIKVKGKLKNVTIKEAEAARERCCEIMDAAMVASAPLKLLRSFNKALKADSEDKNKESNVGKAAVRAQVPAPSQQPLPPAPPHKMAPPPKVDSKKEIKNKKKPDKKVAHKKAAPKKVKHKK